MQRPYLAADLRAILKKFPDAGRLWQRFSRQRASMRDVEMLCAFCKVAKDVSESLQHVCDANDSNSGATLLLRRFDPMTESTVNLTEELGQVFVEDFVEQEEEDPTYSLSSQSRLLNTKRVLFT